MHRERLYCGFRAGPPERRLLSGCRYFGGRTLHGAGKCGKKRCRGCITLKKADILRDPPKTVLDGRRFDIIVSNPPYINSSVIETLSDEVRQEPRLALDGGEDGMNFYRVLLDGYLSCLNKGGLLILEIGYDQAERIRALHPCDILKDYSGNDRVAVIQAGG